MGCWPEIDLARWRRWGALRGHSPLGVHDREDACGYRVGCAESEETAPHLLCSLPAAYAMEMWQLDAFEYLLCGADRRKVTIYQVVDDSTRFDVGSCAFHDPENGRDAVTAVAAAIQAHGVPQELLSDNGVSFNQSRRGSIAPLERFLADRGCLAISGKIRSPTTQGKNARSHQTLQRFLDAHSPATLERVRELISEYRDYYNHRRHHQGLPGEITPGQPWDVAEHHPAGGEPIAHADLRARALAYRDRAAAATAAVAPELVPGGVLPELPAALDPQHTASGRLRLSVCFCLVPQESGSPGRHGLTHLYDWPAWCLSVDLSSVRPGT